MGNICLRGIDDQVKNILKTEAAKSGTSVNALILSYINKSVGLDPTSRTKHNDLDSLAGTWSDTDMDEFIGNTRDFDKIDEELWK